VAHVALTASGPGFALTPVEGLDGASWSDARGRLRQAWGEPFVVDTLTVAGGAVASVDVRHHVRAFFQGNRYLLQALVDDVVSRVSAPIVADLYAGVGLFSLVLAAQGRAVEAVEGDDWAAGDLQANGGPTSRVHVHHRAVETYVQRTRLDAFGTVVVDPPRPGLAPEVTTALVGARVPRVVYVSCDPATLARDVRLFVDGGYAVHDVHAFDLFPRTAHVETVLTLTR
jgi:23S rRNA (uracil1939-C5)-methyltransferase